MKELQKPTWPLVILAGVPNILQPEPWGSNFGAMGSQECFVCKTLRSVYKTVQLRP